ncbi:MAG: DUF4097 family beta strand repeat-containing protein, partial [Gemmatimonadota bacterium]
EFNWHGKIAAGKAIEIKGINGAIRASAASGNEVVVVATKRAKHSDPEEVKIEVVPGDDGVTICAVYPTGRSGRVNDCAAGSAGHSETRNNDVEVEFVVKVPAGVRFIGRTVNGSVNADGLTSDAEAYTVNGGVSVATAGAVQATTVNGSIIAKMGRADWKDEMEFSTVNGSVTLTLPATAGADFEAETVNGSIETEFPVTMQGKMSPRHISGTFGGGGRRLILKTVNGSVHLLKA